MNHKSRHVDWLTLPDDLLYQITSKLFLTKDSVRFGAVCRPWHAAFIENRRRKHKLPMLMLITHYDRNVYTHSFYSLKEKRLCDFQLQSSRNLFSTASFYGWLVTATMDDQVSLFNPFMAIDNNIDLPPSTALDFNNWEQPFYWPDQTFLSRVVLSANPAVNPNYVVMAMYNVDNILAFFKPGDKVWTCIDMECAAEDFIYYRDQFYAIDGDGQVVSYDFNHTPPRKSKVEALAPPYASFDRHLAEDSRYLVEASGELWQVLTIACYGYPGKYKTMRFDVYKLNFVGFTWIKMDSLQGHVFFLGYSSSFSLLASDFPECKPDSIYFVYDFFVGCTEGRDSVYEPLDMGVVNIKDGTGETHFLSESKLVLPVPIWIEPHMP